MIFAFEVSKNEKTILPPGRHAFSLPRETGKYPRRAMREYRKERDEICHRIFEPIIDVC